MSTEVKTKRQSILIENDTDNVIINNNNNNNKQDSKTEISKVDEINIIPVDYIPVKLDSLGKLDAPPILHFRNYLMEEAIELSSAPEEKFIDILISCLNRMVYEDFDCSNLHEKELEEILMTIYLNFWSKTLSGFQYYVDLNKKTEEELNDKENIDDAIIEIAKLKTIPINKDFKEPMKVTYNNSVVKFRLARIKDIIISRNYIEKKYYVEDRTLSDLTTKFLKDPASVTYDEKIQIEEFQNKKGLDLIKTIQANLILEIDGEKFDTLEQKLENYNRVTINHWQEINNYIENKLNFGISSEVDFFSMKLKKEITRRFRFRSMDFLPPVGIYTDTGANLSFGD